MSAGPDDRPMTAADGPDDRATTTADGRDGQSRDAEQDASGGDPVTRAFGGTRDLYGISEWDERTAVDRLAVAVHHLLRKGARPLVVLGATLVLFTEFALVVVGVARSPALLALTLLSVGPALGLAGYVWLLDPTLRQPIRGLLATFLLGGLLAGLPVAAVTLFRPPTAMPLLGGLVYIYFVSVPAEEVAKWLAVRLPVYRSTDFTAVIDGAVYGAMAGLGFATLENAVFVGLTAVGSEGVVSLADASRVAGARMLAGPGHVIYGALAGYYLGLARFDEANRGPIAVKGLLLAVAVHGTHNAVVSFLPAYTTVGPLKLWASAAVGLNGVVLIVVVRKIERYRRLYHEAYPDL